MTIDQDYGIPDSLNRKLLRDVKVGGNTISHEGYGYDPNRPGLLTSVERDDNKRDIFHYDLLPELDWAHYGVPTGGGAAQREVGYEWDKAGNREGVSDNGAYTNYTPVGNQLNQYLQVGIDTVTNGNEHEIAVYQNINYSYINDERLSLVSGPDLFGQQTNYQLNYDALGRTVVRILNGVPTYYIFDGEKPILEYQGGWTQPLASNVYGKGIDEILMRNDSSVPAAQRPYYYQSDHEGSITHLIDINGTVLETYRYDAFGQPTITNTSGIVTNNRFMFTGREYVPQFGIYEYRARAYHPGLGRFMSEDPKLFVRGMGLGKSPDDWSFSLHPDDGELNLFRYCGNDPLDFTDPLGLFPERDFIAGMGDMVTFGQGEKVAEFFYPGYIASVDKSSLAYQLGSAGGIVTGMLNGKGEAAIGKKLLSAAETKALGTARDNLLKAAENPQLKSVINELYRPGAKLGSGSSMDALRQEGTHLKKVFDRQKELRDILKEEKLSPGDKAIVKRLLNDTQNAIQQHYNK